MNEQDRGAWIRYIDKRFEEVHGRLKQLEEDIHYLYGQTPWANSKHQVQIELAEQIRKLREKLDGGDK